MREQIQREQQQQPHCIDGKLPSMNSLSHNCRTEKVMCSSSTIANVHRKHKYVVNGILTSCSFSLALFNHL